MSDCTVQRLEQALERLFEGKPERTVGDGKVNLSRINKEAGLAVGGIYYYKDFIKAAKKKIKSHIEGLQNQEEDKEFEEELSELDRAKAKLKDAERLKKKYRQDFKEQKMLNDGVVAQNISLAFRVLELEDEVKSNTRGQIHNLHK
jgi:hypothetical protein